jgi:TonB family protein
MKKITASLLFFMLCIMHVSLAQTTDSTSVEKNTEEIIEERIVEVLPEFPGGQEAMFRFIGENTTYPDQAKDKGIQGIVHVRFVIDTDGSVVDVEIVRGVHESLDAEALRVMSLMPRWKPATQRGKPVRVTQALPFKFELIKRKKKKKKKT